MQDYGSAAWLGPIQPLAVHRPRRRWLVVAGLALAFVLTLGIGALLGSTIGTTLAAGFAPGNPGSGQVGQFLVASTPGAQGQCGTLTVSSVNGQTITASAPDGTAQTIYTTASTHYTRAGQSVGASAVITGSRIHVDGTRNSDGSITATHIDIS